MQLDFSGQSVFVLIFTTEFARAERLLSVRNDRQNKKGDFG